MFVFNTRAIVRRRALTAALVAMAAPLHADMPPTPSQAGMFPFVIPQDDATKGTATDMSSLSSGPAGANGPIVVKDGHFVEANTGHRIRFFGLNTMFEFPTKAEAESRAAHYAKMGVNLVRCHMEDGYWSPLWKTPLASPTTFDPAALDRMDYFYYQLKLHGIYLDLNMHAGRTFREIDGFPPSITKIPEALDKHIDMLDDRMIQLDQEFNQAYLTHVNPYTHLSYAKDPAVAIIEINNEDTTLYVGTDGPDNYYGRLPEPFRSEVVAKWNAWLLQKYGTTAKVRAAWSDGPALAPGDPLELLSSANVWNLEDRVGDVKMVTSDPGTPATAPGIDVTNGTVTPLLAAKQVHLAGLNLVEGARYVLSFRTKADPPQITHLNVSVDQKDWHNAGLDTSFLAGPKWHNYDDLFQAAKTVAGHSEISVTVGGMAGEISLADFRLHRVTPDDILPAAQSLEAKTVDIATGSSTTQKADWTEFLSDSELNYADRMRAYLRKDLGVQANIVCSQVCYGAFTGVKREAGSDFVDNHLYWGHPQGTEGPLNPLHWKIDNIPLVNDLAAHKETFLLWLAGMRTVGKPYTVSEYNHPAPSDYQAEGIPLLTTFGLEQDWDGIFWFADTATGGRWFNTGGNPAKEAFFPSAALIFRQGLISPAGPTATLTPDAGLYHTRNGTTAEWVGTTHNKVPELLSTRLGLTLDDKAASSRVDQTNAPAAPDSSVTAITTKSGAQYIASGPSALAATGFLGGQSLTSGAITLAFPAFGNNFAALTLTANDGAPLATSHRLLLTIVGRSEFTGQIWNAAHNSVGKDWGTDPALAEGIPATVTLANPDITHVWALDPTGARMTPVPVTTNGGQATFTIGPNYKTVWYEIGE